MPSIHERFDLDDWSKRFPLSGLVQDSDVATALTGPLPVAYIEQARAEVVRAGADLGKPVPADLCVWRVGDTRRRAVTKIGGVPYWPAAEPWPTTVDDEPYTFVAQFCFADSRDLLPRLPGDILSVLASDTDYQLLELRWFELGEGEAHLLPAGRVPAPRWPIQPCHAVLHRTAEYPEARYELFQKYPYPLGLWARRLIDGSKIGGEWVSRGELPNPADIDDAKYRKDIEEAWRRVRQREQTFICQLGSVQATERQPFLNVETRADLQRSHAKDFLMIADVGGYDFFHDGRATDQDMWSG